MGQLNAEQVRSLFRELAERLITRGTAHGLEPDWLNEATNGFLTGPDEHPRNCYHATTTSPRRQCDLKCWSAADTASRVSPLGQHGQPFETFGRPGRLGRPGCQVRVPVDRGGQVQPQPR